jgi:hypothetical protein
VASTLTSLPDFPKQALNFKIKVDNTNSEEPLSKGKITMPKISVKTRNDGSLSRPDAELICQNTGFMCVFDAKYYNSELSIGTVEKTLDDMKLRGTKYGIVICSEDAKTTVVDQVISLDSKLNTLSTDG